MASTAYNISLRNQNIRIFDTVGLEEPQMGVNGYLAAIEKAYQLIISLSEAGGVHLLLFCMRGDRITATKQSNYRLFCEFLCNRKVPVALIVTGLERETVMEDWWSRNESNAIRYGLHNAGHACITAVRDDTPGQAEKYATSEKTIRELLMNCSLKNGAFLMESRSWLAMMGRRMMGLIVKNMPKRKDIVKVLTKRCGLDADTAKRLTNLYSGPADSNKNTTNIVLFGETGVGKSSVINLIAGKDVAKVSSDVDGCTMASTAYNISLRNQNIRIFDTVGLEEPQMGVNGYLAAIEKAHQLILSLSEAGGVHLLLFCMRGDRITATVQSNYRLFCEFLCNKKVPVALVVTGLEREVVMEDWWQWYKSNIEKYGIHSVGHACITAVRDNTPGQAEKYAISEKTIRELLVNCALKDSAFHMDSHNWLAMMGRRMMGLIVKRGIPKRKDIVKVLTKHCGLDADTAKRVAELMREREGGAKPVAGADAESRRQEE
ncbi:hypothetical protein PAXINDRAFT_139574 [Paxillus involutus ATCC 200175]|uniref:G domain-containing protein n=1 Tax=Paxillus involutus ATCC 200175 TaxID=664439 RepID=A0A0C9TA24_PAXIN|nr:hypothetical protein PAXINDRAFT_139574 [Paxillus involutus ATCC 200175]